MRHVLTYLKPYRAAAAAALLLMLVELVVELWHPLLMARVINEGILERDTAAVLQIGGVMAAIALIGFVSGIINSYLAAHVSQNLGFDIRKAMFVRVQRMSYAVYNRFAESSLITRLTGDVTQIQNVVFMGLRIMMRAPLLMIGGLVMALSVNLRLGLILVIVTPVLFGLLIWMMNKSFKLFRLVQDRLDKTNGILRENLLGMRLIRTLVRSSHETARFTEVSDDLRHQTSRALRLIELVVPVMLLVMNLCILLILWLGSFEVAAGGANVGEIVAIINYATRITGAFSVVSFVMSGLSRARASGGRIEEVLRAEDKEPGSGNYVSASTTGAAEIEFDQVTFRYPGMSAPALHNVSFRIKPGSMAAILGATGSGKSTMFQMLPRLYEPEAGTVRLDGTDLRGWRTEELRNQIGYVPQEVMLISGTVRENLLWGRQDAAAEEIMQAAQDAQIHETLMRLPDQYDTVIGQKGVNLSGGQKQRLSVARALLRRPRVMLLDDSTSALDVKTEARLLEALGRYDCTIMIVTQKISAAMKADTIILMEDGSVQDQGSHWELMERSALYRSIVSSQQEEASHG
ncbi:ABC transporter ATP-binding protein [Paenibacillus tarimensis]|uniref:ABC transporter ATP-binding protein n=1 Tax=Paenibacillus tarimensis TaxID=416012 RepID=UPI001F292866|nr:ABC transporter ATP-binding protein [Paenibacillus tarimensis]MCF2944278.1 ABC transporter ATP-binding protein/permease [Paenibacillus tarimensis]